MEQKSITNIHKNHAIINVEFTRRTMTINFLTESCWLINIKQLFYSSLFTILLQGILPPLTWVEHGAHVAKFSK